MKNKIIFVVSLLYGLFYFNSGLNKFLNYMPMPEEMPEKLMKLMGAMMEFGWLMPLLGAMEMLGGLLCIFPKYRALGALILFPISVGIFLTGFVNTGGSGIVMGSIFLVINLWLIYENREKYMPMIK